MNLFFGIITLIVLDIVWVLLVMLPRYDKLVQNIQMGRKMQARLIPGVCAYICMTIGFIAFVADAKSQTSLSTAVLRAGLFGLVLYGVYNGTAMAVFKDWDWKIATLDVAWGMSVYILAVLAYRM